MKNNDNHLDFDIKFSRAYIYNTYLFYFLIEFEVPQSEKTL